MPRLARPLFLMMLVLLVPIVPFVAFGDRLQVWTLTWLDPPPPDWLMATATAAILATDIFLPVPSSVIGTLAGAQLGVPLAAAAAWLGLTAGSVAGFALARRWGRPLAERYCSPDDMQGLDIAGQRLGVGLLIVTRPLPVLAEAAVLWLGTTRLGWRPFLSAVMLSNLGVATVYAALGNFAIARGELPLAIAASIALPLAATALVRMRYAGNRDAANDGFEAECTESER